MHSIYFSIMTSLPFFTPRFACKKKENQLNKFLVSPSHISFFFVLSLLLRSGSSCSKGWSDWTGSSPLCLRRPTTPTRTFSSALQPALGRPTSPCWRSSTRSASTCSRVASSKRTSSRWDCDRDGLGKLFDWWTTIGSKIWQRCWCRSRWRECCGNLSHRR